MDRVYGVANCMKVVRAVGFALFLTSVSAGSLAAQTPTREQPSRWLNSLSIGLPASHWEIRPVQFTMGAHLTRLEPGELGGDFAIGIMPIPLAMGLLHFGARAGLALPLAYSENVLIAPSGGGSLIAAINGIAIPGVNVGATAFMFRKNRSGFRAGVTWHWFGGESGIWLLEFGLLGGS